MPITFTPNPNGPRLGPGVQIGFSSDLIGPLPQGTFWRVTLRGTGGELFPWIVWEKPTQSPFGGHWTPFLLDPGSNLTTNVANTIQAGAAASATVELVTPTAVVDSGTLSSTWDATSGMPFVIDQRVGAQGGGFTSQDRQVLTDTLANTVVNFTQPQLPADPAATPLSRLPWLAPIGGSQRVGPILLTGRGSLQLGPGGVTGIFTGMRWFFTTIPEGFGFTPGAVDEFGRRLLQIVPVYGLGTTEEIGFPVLDSKASGEFYNFPVQPGLERLEYQVPPGVTVTLFLYKVLGT